MMRYLLAIAALAGVLAQSASAQIYDSTTGQQIMQCPTCSGVGATLSNVIVQDAVSSGNTIGVTATKQGQIIYPDAATTTGNITNTQSVTFTNPGGYSTFGYEISGTWTGTITVQAQAISGGAWTNTTAIPFNAIAATAFTANSAGQGSLAGVYAVRFTGATVLSGTAAVSIRGGQGAAAIMPDNATTIAGSAPGTAGTPSANVVSVQGVASGTGLPTNPKPVASGGLSIARKQVANNTTSVAIDASPGQLYGIEAFNNSATIAYVKLYDAAQGSTTCGSGTPVYQGMIPAAAAGGNYVSMNVYGLPFATAITACVTTGFADNDTSAPAASTYAIDYFYK